MARKRYKPEEIVAKLRQVDVLVSQGQGMTEAIRQIGVSEGIGTGRDRDNRAPTQVVDWQDRLPAPSPGDEDPLDRWRREKAEREEPQPRERKLDTPLLTLDDVDQRVRERIAAEHEFNINFLAEVLVDLKNDAEMRGPPGPSGPRGEEGPPGKLLETHKLTTAARQGQKNTASQDQAGQSSTGDGAGDASGSGARPWCISASARKKPLFIGS
jgi:hypothetical protein